MALCLKPSFRLFCVWGPGWCCAHCGACFCGRCPGWKGWKAASKVLRHVDHPLRRFPEKTPCHNTSSGSQWCTCEDCEHAGVKRASKVWALRTLKPLTFPTSVRLNWRGQRLHFCLPTPRTSPLFERGSRCGTSRMVRLASPQLHQWTRWDAGQSGHQQISGWCLSCAWFRLSASKQLTTYFKVASKINDIIYDILKRDIFSIVTHCNDSTFYLLPSLFKSK